MCFGTINTKGPATDIDAEMKAAEAELLAALGGEAMESEGGRPVADTGYLVEVQALIAKQERPGTESLVLAGTDGDDVVLVIGESKRRPGISLALFDSPDFKADGVIDIHLAVADMKAIVTKLSEYIAKQA